MAYKISKRNKYDINQIERSKKGLLTIQNFCQLYDRLSNIYDQKFYQLEEGQVIDIILDQQHKDYINKSDIGKIKVKLIHSHNQDSSDQFAFAYPLNTMLLEYPIIGEIVLCGYYISIQSVDLEDKKSLYSGKSLYYISTINTLNYNLNNNRLEGIHSNNSNQNYSFQQMQLEQLRLKYGQRAIIGRFKNSIIFAKDNLNIQHNGSSIKLYNKNNDVSIGANKIKDSYINQQQVVVTESQVIANKSNTNIIKAKNNIDIQSNNDLYIQAKQILYNFNKMYIGQNAKEAMVLGNRLEQLLKQILTQLSNHTHIAAGSPTSPPIQKPIIQSIKYKVKRILSKMIFIR